MLRSPSPRDDLAGVRVWDDAAVPQRFDLAPRVGAIGRHNERPPRDLIREGQEVQEHLAKPELERNFVRFCESTWEDFHFHLFMRRLRRAGQEGFDFDQDQDIWSDDYDQPPPGAPLGAGRTRTGIRTQPVWLRQGPGGSSSLGQQPPGGGDGGVGASSSSGHHPGEPPPGAGAVAVDSRFNSI